MLANRVKAKTRESMQTALNHAKTAPKISNAETEKTAPEVGINGIAVVRTTKKPLAVNETIDVKRPGRVLGYIEPYVAAYWLEKHRFQGKNRPIIKSNIKVLEAVLNAGEWRDDVPDPIMFDTAGALRNGQHRLEACSRSGVPIVAEIIFGCEPGVYEYLDCGTTRSFADRSSYSTDPRVNTCINQILSGWINYLNGCTKRRPMSERQTFFELHQSALTWIGGVTAHAGPEQKGVSRVGVSVALAQAYEMDPARTEAFQQSLYSTTGVIQQALKLRDFIIRRLTGTRMAGKLSDNTSLTYYTYTALNSYFAGKELLQIKPGSILRGYKNRDKVDATA